MCDLFVTILRVLFCGFHSRHQLLLDNLALRHQLAVGHQHQREPEFVRTADTLTPLTALTALTQATPRSSNSSTS